MVNIKPMQNIKVKNSLYLRRLSKNILLEANYCLKVNLKLVFKVIFMNITQKKICKKHKTRIQNSLSIDKCLIAIY